MSHCKMKFSTHKNPQYQTAARMQKKIRILDKSFGFSTKKLNLSQYFRVNRPKSKNCWFTCIPFVISHPGCLCYLQPNNQFSHFRCIHSVWYFTRTHSLTQMALITDVLYTNVSYICFDVQISTNNNRNRIGSARQNHHNEANLAIQLK